MAFEEQKTPEDIIDDDFDRFEMLMKRLEVEYNTYFQGGRKNPPDEFTRMVKEIVQRYRNQTLKRYSHRFRFATLMSKYSTFNERWGRKLKEKTAREEGGGERHLTLAQRATFERLGIAHAEPADLDAAETAATERHLTSAQRATMERLGLAVPAPAGPDKIGAGGASRGGYAISDTGADRAALEGLFKHYVEAKRGAGEDVSKLKIGAFEKVVAKQVDALRAKGAAGARFDVETKDGKVVLKAAKAK